MEAKKSQLLMLMIASLASGALGALLGVFAGLTALISLPGFIIGAFFAYKFASYDKTKQKEEEHKKSRHRKH